ncbi:MAG: hypothetical protein H7Z11_04065 [Verrucomicrobia bacterium]|nr:hypothetical protein [Leptolyngbya sp. ES-bin-22]
MPEQTWVHRNGLPDLILHTLFRCSVTIATSNTARVFNRVRRSLLPL